MKELKILENLAGLASLVPRHHAQFVEILAIPCARSGQTPDQRARILANQPPHQPVHAAAEGACPSKNSATAVPLPGVRIRFAKCYGSPPGRLPGPECTTSIGGLHPSSGLVLTVCLEAKCAAPDESQRPVQEKSKQRSPRHS